MRSITRCLDHARGGAAARAAKGAFFALLLACAPGVARGGAPVSMTVGNGASTDPTGTTFAAGAKTALDYFNLYTASGTSTISAVTVALVGNTALSSIELRSGAGCTGTQLGTTITNPGASAQFTGLSLPANSTGSNLTNYTVCGTGEMVASNTVVNVDVSAVTYSGTFNLTYSDTGNNFTVSTTTLTIGSGSDPVGSNLSAGTTTVLDTFTLATSVSSTTVNTVATALTGSTGLTSLALWTGAGCTGTNLASATPGATPTFTGLSLAAGTGTGATTYYICGTAATVGTDTPVSINVTGVTPSPGSPAVTDNDTGPSFTVLAPPLLTINDNDGTNVDPIGATFSAGVATALDYFTLSTNTGSSTVSAVTVAVTGNAALSSLQLRSGLGCTGTLLQTVNAPGTSATFGTLSLPANTTGSRTTNYTVCGTGAMVASAVTPVSVNVSGVTYTGTYTVTDSDGANAFTLSATTLTIGNGGDPVGSNLSAGTTTVLDTFTVSTSASSTTVNAVATALTGSTGLTSLALWTGAGCTGTNLATAAPGATPSFTGLSLAAGTGTGSTTYYVCGTTASVGVNTTVSINVTGVTLSAGSPAVTDNDTGPNFTVLAPALLTIGNGTDPAGGTNILYGATAVLDTFTLYTNSGSTTVNAVAMQLTGNAALSSISLWTGAGCTGTNPATVASPTATPSFGSLSLPANNTGSSGTTYYICGTAGSVAASTTVSVNVSGVTPSSGSWTYADNDTGPSFTVPVPGTVTISAGANPQPGNANLNVGAILPMNKFRLLASATGATATSITVSLTNGSALSAASIHGDAACTSPVGSLGTVVNGTNVIPVSFTVPTGTAGTYYLCGTGGTVGVATAVSGNVTSVAANGFTSTGSDTTSATLTVQPSASVTTSVADGSNPTPPSLYGPIASPVAIDVDGFDVAFTGGSDSITAVQVTLGTLSGIGSLTITDSLNAPHVTVTPTSLVQTITLTTPITAAGSYKIRITPLSATTMPPPNGGTYAITARITDITVTSGKSVTDTASGTLTIDNASPGIVSGLSALPGSGQATVSWTGEPADADFTTGGEVVVLFKAASAPAGPPTEGVDYIGSGSETAGDGTVGCVAAPGVRACTVGNLSSSNTYYFVAFARDARLNYSLASLPAGPVQPSALPVEGSSNPAAPMISIVNPLKGSPVSGKFRVQVRVFNPGGIANISGLALSDNDGSTYAYTTATTLSTFDTPKIGTVTGRTYEFLITPAAGLRALRARVTNAVVTPTFVLSNGVSVNVLAARTGDGKLLVRDNSSQLCSDCHAGVMTHSSESTGTEFGSWATTCRDCHTAHTTTNVGLVRETVSAPAVGANPPTNRSVDFKKIDGGYTATPSLPSNPSGFANGTSPASGVCQVCHTRTQYYRQDGFDYPLPGQLQTASGGHYPSEPGGCGSCHKHTAGLQADCSGCHGDNSATPRTTFSKTAPPRDTCGNWDALTNLGNGPNRVGAHAKHLTGGTYGNAVACAQCHTNPPTSASNPNHGGTTCGTNLTTDRAVMTWGTLATGGVDAWSAPATTPTATKSTTSPTTCSNTYCHGRFPNGNNATPAWNGTAACGSCHGLPPPVTADVTKNHPNNTACDKCHGAGYSTTAVNKATHIDGQLQKPNKGCASCHGELTVADGTNVLPGDTRSAPGYAGTGVDTTGNALVTVAGVGAHRAHFEPTSATGSSPAIACTQCHVQPVAGNTDHADAAFDWNWGAIARDGIRLSPTYSSATKQCSSVYCHSNANPLGGLDSAPATQAWTDGTNMGCAGCHQVATYGGTGLSAKHERHVSNVTGYGYGCVRCHVNSAASNTSIVTGGGQHVDGTRDVDFDSSGPDNSLGGYNYGTYQCSNIYCHSDGVKRSSPYTSAAIAWNGTTTCSSCHLSGTAMATNAHQAHVNQAGTYGTTWGCQTCHYPTTHDGSSIFATANHANALSDVEGAAAGTLKYQDVGNTSPNSCTTYCHSAGRDPLATAQYYSDMDWKATALSGCSSCHGRFSPADPLFATSYGAPNYTSGGTATATANSHRKHVSGPGDCYTCHKATVNAAGNAIVSATTHLDGSRQVSFDALAAGAGAVYSNDVNKRCSSVSCHPSGPVQWGGPTQTCASCHLRATANGGDQNDFAGISNGIAALVNTEEWTNFGHGSTGATFLDAGEFGQAGITNRCVYCHDDQNSSANHKQAGNPFRLRGKAAAGGATALYDTTTLPLTDAVCLNCHDISANSPAGVDPDGAGGQPLVGPATTRISAYHAGGKHKADNGGQRCWDCHDPHGDGSNIKMIGADLLVWSSDASGYAGTRSTDAPQNAPVSFTLSGIGGYTDTVGPPYNGVCQVCHRTTDHLSAATGMLYWLSDGTGSHNADQDCVSCHTHQQPPNNAFAGAGACSSCHLAVADAGTNSDRDEFPPSTTSTLKSWVDREDWYATGHGRTTTNYTQSNNPPANFPAPTQTVEPCYYCHAPDTALFTGGETSKHTDVAAGNPFRLANTAVAAKPAWGKNGNCLICHGADATGFDPDGSAKLDYGSIIGAKRISATHYGAKHDATHDGGTLCWDCHDPHGDKNYTTGREVAYMVQLQPLIDSADAWGASGTFVSAANAVDFNMAKAGVTTTLEGQDYVSTLAPYNGVCQVCHTNTVAPGPVTYWTAAGGGTTHENGGARCTSCHGHEQTPNLAFKQATGCADCHAAPPATGEHAFHVGASTPAYGDVTAHSTTSAYAFGCGKCHTTVAANHWNDTGGTAADPFVVNMGFDWTSGATPYTAGVAASDTNPTSGLVFKTSPGTCATYCHSDGQPLGAAAPTYKSPTWVAATYSTCTECHNTTTTLVTNKHGQHLNVTTNPAIGTAYVCADCHNAEITSGNGPITNKTLHVNGAKDASFPTRNGMTSAAYATPNCGTNYCHSSGRPALTSADTSASKYYPVAWNGAALDCRGCHGAYTALADGALFGFTSLYGEPNYKGGAAGAVDANSHQKHVNAVTDCNNCHTSTSQTGTAIVTGSTLHTDGLRQVTIAAAYDSDATPGNNYTELTKGCANTKCHGTNAPVWGGTLACNVCHGAPPSGASSGAHAKHEGTVGTLPTAYADTSRVSATKYGIACSSCHAGTHGNGTGAPWSAEVSASLTYTGTGTTTSQTEVNGQVFNWTTNKSCATDCHSDGGRMQAAGTYVVNRINPTGWNQVFAAGCTGCHGAAGATTTLSLAHINHINTGTYNMPCQRCHASTVNTTPAISDFTKHVNLARDYQGGSFTSPGGTAINDTGMVLQANHTCTASYCHSNGQSQTAPFTSTSNAWNAAAPACTNCHATTGLTSGSHLAHLAAPNSYGCAVCHSTVAASNTSIVSPTGYALHVNGEPTVAMQATYGGTYDAVNHTCSNVSCHGSQSTAGALPTWGTATSVTCRRCHGKTTGAADDDADNWSFASPLGSGVLGATNPMTRIDLDDWSTYGHGKPTLTYAQSGHNAAIFDGTTGGMTPTKDGCVYCHLPLTGADHDTGMVTNPFRLANVTATTQNGVCTVCHAPGSTGYQPTGLTLIKPTQTQTVDSYHYGTDHSTLRPDGGGFCWDCHDPHGDYNYTQAKALAFMFQEYPTTDSSGAPGTAGNWGIPLVVPQTAYVNFFDATDGTVGWNVRTDYYVAATAPNGKYNGVCQVCHPTTSATALHFTDGAAPETGHNSPTGCMTCHKHQQTTNKNQAFKGDGTCLACHGAAADADEFSTTPSNFWSNATASKINTAEWTYSGHGKTAGTFDITLNPAPNFPTTPTPGESECRYCHDETTTHNPGAATNPYRLRGVSTAGVTAAWVTTAPNAVCLNCHANSTAPGVTPSSQTNKTATKWVTDTHFGSKHANGEGGQFCWDCHDPHGDRISTGGNILMMRSQVFKATDGVYGINPTLATVNFTTEGAGPPAVGKLVEATNATRTGLCQACHASTSTTPTRYWLSNGQDDPDGATGAAGYTSVHDVNETDTTYCIRCHKHTAKFETGSCKSCHTSTAADTDAFTGTANSATGFWNNLVASNINETEWTYSGHGKTGTNYDQSLNPPAAFPTTVPGESECRYCHDDAVAHVSGSIAAVYGNPYLLRGTSTAGVTSLWSTTAPNDVCLNCHGSSSAPGVTPSGLTNKKATKYAATAHYGAKHTTTGEGGKFCWDCHEPHGDRISTGGNIEMIRSQVFFANDGTYGINPTLKNVTWNTMAGGPPAVGKLVEDTTPTTRVGLCQACHSPTSTTPTKYWLSNGTLNTHNAGETDPAYCVKCHPHDDNFKGSGTCIGCHGSATSATPPRAAVVTDFARKSRHVSNGTTTSIVTNYDCILCHAEGDLASSGSGATEVIGTVGTLHGNDGGAKTVELRNVDYTGALPGTAGTAYWSWPGYRDTGTTWTATVAQRDSMDTFCMKCHDTNGAAGAAVNKNNPANGMLYSGTTLPTLAQAQKPFNVNDTLANNWDAAALNAVRTVVLNVRDQFNSGNAVGKNWASHHNLNQFTKRYTTNNNTALPTTTWQSHTLKDGQNIVPGGTPTVAGTGQGVVAGLHCSDCHLNEANAHGSANTPYMLADYQGTDTAFSSHGTTTATGNCVMCHNRAVYGSSSTDSRFDHADCTRFGFTTMSLMGGSGTNGADECLGCHGGGKPGRIHGTNETYAPLGSGTSRMYRFQGGGGTWRYYSPNNTANPTDTVGGTWDSTGTPNCYTIGAVDTYGGCTSHTTAKGGVAGQPTRRARPLVY